MTPDSRNSGDRKSAAERKTFHPFKGVRKQEENANQREQDPFSTKVVREFPLLEDVTK